MMRLRPVDPESPIFDLRDEDARLDEPVSLQKLKRKLSERLDELATLQDTLYADGRQALLVVLQGRDAAGKDGTIRKVFGTCSPNGCQVTDFGPPTSEELKHDFLWRIHKAVPATGTIGIFNRSQYEDVLTARVRDLVPKEVWLRRYDQINDFEQILVDNGVVILKLFLHISRAEQRRRMLKRIRNPHKNWKFHIGDLDDRALWSSYTEAYRDVFRRCSTRHAPWYLVPADDKHVRNYLVADVIVRTLRQLNLSYPSIDPDEMKHAEQVLTR
jgi:PPK2 family polyphosphate:nucleotide phosphotransferase